MKNPQQIPTGWTQLDTVSILATNSGALIDVPNPGKWRKYLIAIAPTTVPMILTREPGLNTVSALYTSPNRSTHFGPFDISTRFYLVDRLAIPHVTTANVTLWVSREGEIDELVRYLLANGGGTAAANFPGVFVGRWDPADFVEGGGVDFGVTATRNYHPILQLGENDDDPVGGVVNGVLPANTPIMFHTATVRVYWTGQDKPGAGDAVVMAVAFELDELGFDIDSDVFGAALSLPVAVPINDGELAYTDFVFQWADAEQLLPGQLFRILLTRTPGAVGDDYASTVQIVCMAMWINP